MVSSAPSSSPKQSKIPTYSGFFEIFIKVQGTETREKKLLYFNKDRGFFYSVEAGQSEVSFRGPGTGLIVIAYVDGGSIVFPARQHEKMESILPARNDTDMVSEKTQSALEIALDAQKPIYQAPSTSPSYFPKTGDPRS